MIIVSQFLTGKLVGYKSNLLLISRIIYSFKLIIFLYGSFLNMQDYGFVPQTYVLPYDFKLLKRAWDDGSTRQKWILKPVI